MIKVMEKMKYKNKKKKSKFKDDVGYNNLDLDQPDNIENGENSDE